MHRSTLVFAILSVVLLIGIGAVGVFGWLGSGEGEGEKESFDASLMLGIPDLSPDSSRRVISARSAVVWNSQTQSLAFEQDGFERLPLASLTKLMTAMVALDRRFDWEAKVTIEPNEYVVGGNLLLQPGEFVSMRDLFTASLLSSANNTTLAYVRALGATEEEFVREMNRKAVALELEQTFFTDVTGLDKNNISTAYEVARMADYAFKNYPDIANITRQSEYSFTVGGTQRAHTIRNSNKLVAAGEMAVSGSKTGYLYEAGYCLVLAAQDMVAVVLGSPSEDAHYQAIKALLSQQVQ